ncbi:MAG: hypothetical protein Q8M09_17050 [Pseudomonadota bacterium]|nr:hypothetical protein [Pseudomonadota bacterium]MDP1905926.1 hypothetical protein [Pseudomonadota bacterium]MDP2353604.1 hypothetical protein [Pseudomonadota bacterium]
MSAIRPTLIAFALIAALGGCASHQVIVSGNKSVSYEHNPDELAKVGKQAMEHCAKLGKEAKLDNTSCPSKKVCVTTFSCLDK